MAAGKSEASVGYESYVHFEVTAHAADSYERC
jgi:hypothetical protein